MTPNPDILARFTQKAEAVSAKVSRVKTLKEAFAYTVDLCDQKDACQILASGCGEKLSKPAAELCETKAAGKIIAAPTLRKNVFNELRRQAKTKSIEVIDSGLRNHLGGIDIGFTLAEHGIAETGSLVVDSASEDLRLATMISEFHVAVVKASSIVATSFELADFMRARTAEANYMAFITGPSRTADIERVLALGVHGPLELHILIWEDKR
jgi:L-lactate dehydrogenase complex protein LldG